MTPRSTVLLTISEEYGYRNWYAVLSSELYEQLKKDWQTLKGLNCLVPVQFLIPQARPLWILPYTPEHSKYLTLDGLAGENVRIRSAHIHQADDSHLDYLDFSIPEQEDFEFRGKAYTEKEVSDLHEFYSDQEQRMCDRYAEAYPQLAELPVMYPEVWHQYSENVPKLKIKEIFVWPEDQPLPPGFVRDENGRITREDAHG